MKTDNTTLLQNIYQRMLEKFGPQDWWPGESREEIIIGAILTQNTNWNNVDRAIKNLKRYSLLDFARLSKISEKKLGILIRPSGYYNQKAARLKSISQFFQNNSLDKYTQLSTDELRKELLSIHGIGEETADSILLYALDRPIFVIDAYTKRIFNRLGFFQDNISYKEAQKFFMKHIQPDTKLYNEYHALLVKFGKEFCKKLPKCEGCFLRDLCKFYRSDQSKEAA
ncbi:MAG: endonuclease III domain-containing protein [Candidatus Cloacimonadia bacterium]